MQVGRVTSAAGIVAIVSLVLFASGRHVTLVENAAFAFDPTAERAFHYGTRHFDASHPDMYDLDRASYFFAKASEIDPEYPYLNHQEARIAFLKGDFATALTEIDREIEVFGTEHANAYYVRGLIKGFKGDYAGAAEDYEVFLRKYPKNWAAINDYAWVLLKGERYRDALVALDWGLMYWPENPWLHNNRATALFEMGRLEAAREAAAAASRAVTEITEADWLEAYPGNDPLIAAQGIAVFKAAVEENMHTIELALEKEQKDMR